MKKKLNTDEFWDLWTMLEQAHSGITLARDRELEKHGISTIKAAALFIIDSIGDEATPAEISRWIVRRPHSVSGLLDRMERDGLINKAKNLHKKNLVRVTITPKGRKAYETSLKRKTINQSLSALTAHERKELYGYLEKLRNKALKVAGILYKPVFPAASKSK